MSHQPNQIYLFGPYRLNAAERLLLRDGEIISLQPKVFDLLLALVERRGRLASKDELMKAVWPDTVVEEANLSNNISILRKTLSNNGDRFIETAPKQGYRFVASVRETAYESVEPAREKQPETMKDIEEPLPAAANGAPAIARAYSEESTGAWLWSHKRVAAIIPAVLVVAAIIAFFAWESLRKKSGGTIESIAVLPFSNTDPNTEYLSDGITESLINSLSQLPQLKVIARTTAFRYKGKEADPRTVGRDLDVDAVLTGKLVQQGNSLVIQAELVNTSDGAQMWGERYERYERKLADIFTAKEEIVRQISERLRTPLTAAERKQIAKRYTENIEAYQHYLMGRRHAEKRSFEAYRQAIEQYNQALELDSNFALAYVGLADAYYIGKPPQLSRDGRLLSMEAAMKALAIDETLGEAHTSLGRVLWQYEFDWQGAERELKRGLDLDPGSAFAHRIYGYYLASKGQHQESVAQSRQARQLDPLSPIINLDVASMLYHAGETDLALAQCRKTREMFPDFAETYHTLGMALAQKGEYAEAIAELNQALPISGRFTGYFISVLGYNYALLGKRSDALRKLDELKELSRQKRAPSFWIAVIYTGLGDKDRAFEWLERAYDERFGLLVYIKDWSLFESLRSDPRFSNLVRRIGIPQ
jgi:TolB-like protein/DNA-binding winged helix-turn-helix (wHTH) protein